MTSRFDRREFLAAVAAVTASSVLPAFGAPQTPLPAEQIEYGADYYPEDWPTERLETDARLMQQAKFRTIRLVDTNWERLQPAENRYDFGWLDRVIDILNRAGMRVILCTSSYVPPAWLVEKHPDFYLVNEAGVRHRWGGMGFLCLNNPLYRQSVAQLVTAMATHYGRHPGVIGWQIDNEMGVWGAECYDEAYCQPKYRQYLKDKFHTVDELNRRLATVSYGHTYSDWEQILLRSNVAGDALQAPLVMESQRFFSNNIVEFMAFQAGLLRQHTSGQFITHNVPVSFVSKDCFAFARAMDFLSEDSYPHAGEYTTPGFTTDQMRGFNQGKSFQVLEIRSGARGPYTLEDATPPPGLARLWAWQALAHGADGVLFFRWRMSNGGSEQYWQGLMSYDGTPSVAFPEVERMGAELEKVGAEIAHAETPSMVAEILSYDSLWALGIAHRSFPYLDQLTTVAASFRRWSLNVNIVEPTADLTQYKIVAAPSLHVVDAAIVENLEKFVSNGGVLILSARSGFKNQDNLATQVPPGPLGKMAGVLVRNFTLLEPVPGDYDKGAYRPSTDNVIRSANPDWPGTYKAKGWADILELNGATPLFHYDKDYYAGKAAVTVADYGKGKVIYVGSLLEPQFYVDLARRACAWAKVEPGPELPDGMDFALRRKGQRSFRFLLNFSDTPQTVEIPDELHDLISGKIFSGKATVPALELCVLAGTESKT